MKFGNEFWLILFREYISPKLFAVWGMGLGGGTANSERPKTKYETQRYTRNKRKQRGGERG
jgi:hypothetical protein